MRSPFRVVIFAACLAAGCKTPEEKMTPAEWLRENTYILDQLGSYDQKERHQGVNRFLKLGKDQGTEVVTFLLNDPKLDDYRIEVVLARILAEWKDQRAIPYLIMSLKSRDRGAVEMAREGLAVFGEDPAILNAVDDLLADPDPRTREIAVAMLSEMSGPKATELLADRLGREEDREIRAHCVLGVAESRHPRRREFLVKALADPDSEIRRTAWGALSREKPPVRFDPDADPAAREKAVRDLQAHFVR